MEKVEFDVLTPVPQTLFWKLISDLSVAQMMLKNLAPDVDFSHFQNTIDEARSEIMAS
jgi:hypothetical protein